MDIDFYFTFLIFMPTQPLLIAIRSGPHMAADRLGKTFLFRQHLREWTVTLPCLHQPNPSASATSQAAAALLSGTPLCSQLSPHRPPPSNMLSILRKARLKDKEMRILMLGLDNAGKTTIVKCIMKEDVNTVSPTLGFIIKTIEYSG